MLKTLLETTMRVPIPEPVRYVVEILDSQARDSLNSGKTDIPGVIIDRYKRLWSPANAIGVVTDMLRGLNLQFRASAHSGAAGSVPPIENCYGPEVREWVPDWLVDYQKEAVSFGCSRPGTLVVHPTGCVASSAGITVNRGGGAKRMSIKDLVFKFNGGDSPGRWAKGGNKWDLSIPTMTQSVDEHGTVRLNEIVAAYESGVKPTIEVWAGGNRRIRATADHKFLTPHGYLPLGELKAGDEIARIVRGGAPKADKPGYRYVGHMQGHPFVTVAYTSRKERLFRVPEHRLIAEAALNGISLAELVGRVHLGQIEGIKFLDPATTHVHHKNRDPQDNRKENLEIIESGEHLREHGIEHGFRNVLARVGWSKITKLKQHKPEATYDLSMADPMNNFVANRLVVHNSGKSATSIIWGLATPGTLVIATRAAAKGTLRREVERLTTVQPLVLEGVKDTQPIPAMTRVVIVGYETMPAWIDHLLKLKPTSVVLDESHKAKDRSRWDRISMPDGTYKFFDKKNIASSVAKLAKAGKRRMLTTATPIKNKVDDLWAQLDYCEPGAWGSGWTWIHRYAGAVAGEFGGVVITGLTEEVELKARMAYVVHSVPYSRSHKALPPKRRNVIYLRPDDLDSPLGGFAAELKKARNKSDVLEIRLAMAASCKRSYISEHVAERAGEGQKCVVFTGRKKDCAKLEESIKKALVKAKKEGIPVWMAHGDHSGKERDAIREAYMATKGGAVLIGTGDAWGESVNLQDTDDVTLAQIPWTPGQVIQWEGRFTRLGQERPVLINYPIAAGTVDEHVAGILIGKLPAVVKVVGDEQVSGLERELDGDEEEIVRMLLHKMEAEVAEREKEKEG